MPVSTDDIGDIARYAAGVRAACDDLSPADREDILHDLESHLAEVAEEGEGPLAQRLGTPEEYAAELRRSAGLPRREGRSRRSRVSGLISEALPAAARELRSVGPLLAPAVLPLWWLLRGVLGTLLVAMILAVPFVVVGGMAGLVVLLGLLVVVGLASVAVSVGVGRRAADATSSRRALIACGNVALPLALLLVLLLAFA